MSIAIILGDPHIGKGTAIGKSGIGASLNSRIVDQINLLDWTLERAIEHQADNLIITGDVFEDTKPHHSLITIFIAFLKKCQVYNINVHILMGNHDILRSGNISTSALDIIIEMELDNVSVYKDIDTILIGSTAFTMLPFRDRKFFSVNSNAEALTILQNSLTYEAVSIPETYKKVLIGHLAVEGSIPVGDEIDDIANELFCQINMFEAYDYVWMGHVHKPQVMSKANPYIAHIGSMDTSNFAETDHKKHIIIINCDANVKDFDTEDLPTRPLKKLSIIIPKDIEDTTSYVIEEIKKEKADFSQAIVKVEVSLSSADLKPINKSMIEKFLSDAGAFNINSILESRKISLIKKSANNSFDIKTDAVSAIKTYAHTYVDVKIQDSFIELALDILNTYKAEIK